MTDDAMLEEFRMNRPVSYEGESYRIVGVQFHCHAPAAQILIFMVRPEGSSEYATEPAKEVMSDECVLLHEARLAA